MISTEWGAPKNWKTCFNPQHVADGQYGTHLNVFDWKERKLIQRIDLGLEGVMPLEIRFLHDPKATIGFVGCALNAKVFRWVVFMSEYKYCKKKINYVYPCLPFEILFHLFCT